jgi:hypothetical protein
MDNHAESLLLLLLLLLLLFVQGKVAEHKDELMADATAALSMLLETPLKDMPAGLLLKVSSKAEAAWFCPSFMSGG